MRRSEKAITERAAIDGVIRRSRVCRLGLVDDGQPYVVPLCFGYDGDCLYFHSALEGRKIDLLRKDNRVCVEFDVGTETVEREEACEWGILYQSAIVFGTVSFVEDEAAKRAALDLIMRQYSDGAYAYPDHAVARTAILRVDIETITGKQSLD